MLLFDNKIFKKFQVGFWWNSECL